MSTRTYVTDAEGRPLARASGLPPGYEVVFRRTGEASRARQARPTAAAQPRLEEIRRLSAQTTRTLAKIERLQAELVQLREKRDSPGTTDSEARKYEDDLQRLFPGLELRERAEELDQEQQQEQELAGVFPWITGGAA